MSTPSFAAPVLHRLQSAMRDAEAASGDVRGLRRPAPRGEVAERLNAAVSKTVVLARAPGVRIPPSPLQKAKNRLSRPGPGDQVLPSLGRAHCPFLAGHSLRCRQTQPPLLAPILGES